MRSARRRRWRRLRGWWSTLGCMRRVMGWRCGGRCQGPVQVCVIGEDDAAEILEATAMARYAVNKSVVRLRREQLDRLPPALAETLPFLPVSEGSVAVVCRGNTCLPPVETAGGVAGGVERVRGPG